LCQDLAVIGAPFTITTWIDGEVIRGRAELDQLVDEELRGGCASMIDVLASLHAVDPNAVGLEDFGRPQSFVVRQVALWRRQWEQVKTRELADLEASALPAGAATAGVGRVGDPARGLSDRQPDPRPGRPGTGPYCPRLGALCAR